jgi:hypothetical protein
MTDHHSPTPEHLLARILQVAELLTYTTHHMTDSIPEAFPAASDSFPIIVGKNQSAENAAKNYSGKRSSIVR